MYLYVVERRTSLSRAKVWSFRTLQSQSSLTVIHRSASKIVSIYQQKKWGKL